MPAAQSTGGTLAAPSQMPVGDIPGWRQILAEDFTTDVPLGGFTPVASGSNAGTLLTGAAAAPYGSKLSVYPSGYNASSNGKSRPEKVLDVAGSCLRWNFSVDAVTGEAMAATVHWNIQGQYNVDPTVGIRSVIRYMVVNGPALSGWGGVAQLIASDANWGLRHNELDYLEGDLSQNMETNWHPNQTANSTVRWGTQPWGNNVWHQAIVEFLPIGNPSTPGGRQTVYIDGVKIGETVGDRIATDPMALIAFQTGVNSVPPAAGGIYPPNGQVRGQLLIDYMVAYVPVTAVAGRMSGGALSVTPGSPAARMSGGVLSTQQPVVAARMSGGVLSSPGATPAGRYRYDLATGRWKPYTRYRYNAATGTWQARPYGAT